MPPLSFRFVFTDLYQVLRRALARCKSLPFFSVSFCNTGAVVSGAIPTERKINVDPYIACLTLLNMDFPVYVASDCYGGKINVALRYNPRRDGLGDLYASADHAFALFTLQHVLEPPLQPFAFVYVYNDVLCAWDLLSQEAQLSPCCQLYAFRVGGAESVDTIPDPINLLVQPTDGATSRGQSTDQHHRASASPDRPFDDAWEGQRWEAERGEFNGYGTPSPVVGGGVAAPHCSGHRFHLRPQDSRGGVAASDGQRRFAPPALDTSYRSTSSPAVEVSTASFSAIGSHRFRLQLLSPPRDVSSRLDTNISQFHTRNFRSAAGPSPPTYTRTESSPAHTSLVPHDTSSMAQSAAHGRAVDIPRAWYDPTARHTAASLHGSTASSHTPYYSSADTATERQQLSVHVSPVRHSAPSATETSFSRRRSYPRATLSSRPRAPPPPPPPEVPKELGPPPLYPSPSSPPSASRGQSRRGGSILREERERVEERMGMNLSDLRASLQNEERWYERSRSSSPQNRRR